MGTGHLRRAVDIGRGTIREAPRLGWLDGLRGVAAVQVVLLHYVSAFLPVVGMTYPLSIDDFGWRALASAPLVFLYDGGSAVFLFFITSGVALTLAFTPRPFDLLPNTTRRIIRLGLPMAAAMLLAAAMFSLLPDAHVTAAWQTRSSWLRDNGPDEISAASIVHQIAFEGLLAGSSDWTLLPIGVAKALRLIPTTGGLNAPLWTLHLEFCGSLLVMLLVAVRAYASHMAYRMTCIVLGSAFVLSPLGLFVLGHVAAGVLPRMTIQKGHAILGAAFLGSGILLCSVKIGAPIAALWKLLPPPPVGLQGDPATLQKMIGAVLVFGGLALLPILQRQLERPTTRWLGKISFSLYLTHFPLLLTLVAALFTVLHHTLPYAPSIAIASIAGIAASIAIAIPFERWIDRPSIMLSRIAGRRIAAPEPIVEPA
jgi:peptidoglycan/LPS O-acetylase OafA/YrhL